jgi:hypothetical protein
MRFWPVWPGMSVAAMRSGRSVAVRMQATPGSARAFATSRLLSFALARSARTTLACSMPGMT